MPVVDTVFPEVMTRQMIFDHAAVFLLKQGKKSEEQGFCKYRGPEGTACAIGCLIRDDEYDSKWDWGSGVSIVFLNLPVRLSGAGYEFLRDLQKIHDNGSPKTWPFELRGFANFYRLSFTVLNA